MNIISVDISLIKYCDLFEIEIRSLNSVDSVTSQKVSKCQYSLVKKPKQDDFICETKTA